MDKATFDEKLSGGEQRTEIELPYGKIILKDARPGVFAIVGENITSKDEGKDSGDLVFIDWDAEVKNLDEEAEVSGNLVGSSHLRWEDVEITPEEIIAPSVERAKEALTHFKIIAGSRLDI